MVRRGFTLIELLAVIAIIAILISLSIVSLVATRRSGRTLQCQIQLRQVGTALESMRDRDGLLPSMRPPVGPRSKRMLLAMQLEFTGRWYAALGGTLTPSSDTGLTTSGWSLWEAPKPWRCPADDPTKALIAGMLESDGFDPRWSAAAQVGTSYDYIGSSASFAPLIRGKADEATMRRTLTRASELYPLAPLIYDVLPFHYEPPGLFRLVDTHAYYQDGSVSVLKAYLGENQSVGFTTHVRKQFFNE